MKVGGRRQRGWKGEAGVREGANKGRQERGRQESTTQGAKQSCNKKTDLEVSEGDGEAGCSAAFPVPGGPIVLPAICVQDSLF